MQDDKDNPKPAEVVPAPAPISSDEGNPDDMPKIELPPSDDRQADKPSKLRRAATWLKNHRTITVPATVIIVLIVLALIPWSRYHAAGLVLKKDFSIKVIDSTAGTPVSGALVGSGKLSGLTNANGVATLRLPVGKHSFSVTKKYYAAAQSSALVPISGRGSVGLKLVATGRQVGVEVKDSLSGKVLGDVDIEVAGISAKTDAAGKALLVLPAGKSQEEASLSLDGYNDAKSILKISGQKIEQNQLSLTPSGKIYFLSKRTGKLNVMKANLDGTDAQVVVAATGYEQVDSSALSQSPDGKYVVLETQRRAADKTPQLYILSASDDQLLTFDSGDVDFTIIGWSGDELVYTASGNTMADWQAGKEKIKSYDASSGKTTILDSVAGSDPDTDVGQTYDSVWLTANRIVYAKDWSDQSSSTAGRKNTIEIVEANGQKHQVVASYDAATVKDYLYQYAPNSFYIETYDNSGSSSDALYYDYTVGGSFKKINTPSSDQLYNNPVYYFSPQADQTYWSESRDGRDTLITADAYGSSGSQKAQATGYSAAGWYSGKYLLATNRDQDQLYVMALGGPKPVKVADYQSTYVY